MGFPTTTIPVWAAKSYHHTQRKSRHKTQRYQQFLGVPGGLLPEAVFLILLPKHRVDIGEALGAAIVAGGILLFREVISPWWKNTAWPWVKEKGRGIKNAVSGKRSKRPQQQQKQLLKNQAEPDRRLADVSSQIDKAFEQFYFEMDEEEAKAHMMRLVYHMLGVVNEIRIIAQARIRKDCESEELCIERQKEAEKFLSEKVAAGLDQLLSNENLRLDLNTSRELFSLTGGGVLAQW